MVMLEPEDDIVEPLSPVVSSFFWYLPYSEVKDLEGRGTRVFSFESRFVPGDKYSAAEWFYESEEAAGLRSQSEHMVLIRINNRSWLDTRSGQEGAEQPEDFLYSDAVIDTGAETDYPGFVIEAFEAELSFSVVANFSFFTKTYEFADIQMGLLSPQAIKQMAVKKIVDPVIYNDDAERTPRIGGPEDLELGTYSSDTACYTCQLTYSKNYARSCPGHFGYISLEIPVPNYVILGGSKGPNGSNPILHALNATCLHCNHILLDDENLSDLEYTAENVAKFNLKNVAGYDIIRNRLKNLMKKQYKTGTKKPKSYQCPHCNESSPQIDFSYMPKGQRRAFTFFPKDEKYPADVYYPYLQIRNWLANIPRSHAAALGFSQHSQPEHMFFENLPVAPNTSRPPAELPSGAYSPNDLTELYSQVIRINNRIRRVGANTTAGERLSLKLFQAVSQTQTGQNPGIGSAKMKQGRGKGGMTTRNTRGVWDRIKGVGRAKNAIRRVHQSKVGEQAGYSTITPDPWLQLDQVGVPLSVCTELTLAVKVTKDNIEFLRQCVINGKQQVIGRTMGKYTDVDMDRYPGAALIQKKNGARVSLKPEKGIPEWAQARRREEPAQELEVGDIVHRNIIADDMVCFTRAPALHRQSMLALRVAPMKQSSFSFNPSVCIPFNADYDGDAMRIFVPQGEEAIEEMKTEFSIAPQMLHSRYGRLFLTFDQDEISGSYLLTFRNTEKAGTPVGIETKHSVDENGNKYSWTVNNNGLGFDDNGQALFSKHRALNLLQMAFSRSEEGLTYATKLPKPIKYKGEECYRGMDIMSVFIPDGIHAEFKDKRGGKVRIEDGKIIEGVLDANAFGTKGGVLGAAFIYRFGWDEGHRQLMEVTNHLSRLVFAAHVEMGFTLGIGDISFKSDNGWSYQGIEGGREIWKKERLGFYERLEEKHYEVSEKIRAIEEKYNDHALDAEDVDMRQFFKEPMFTKEEAIDELVSEYEKFALDSVKETQPSDNAMNITLNSGGRGNPGQLQQMTGTYGQVKVGDKRPVYGINHDRVLPHYAKGDFSGEARGLMGTSYAQGHSAPHYFLGAIAGRRSTMESSQGGIQKSGYMTHRMKRGMENLMVDYNRHVIDVRTNQICSFTVGSDNLRPNHARGPDNEDGMRLSLQPLFMDFKCIHDKNLHDECKKCAESAQTSRVRILNDIADKHTLSRFKSRILDPDTQKLFVKRAKQYIDTCQVRVGEMIGSTIGSNLGEPATQAGLRAFHGGGKGSVPTVDRLIHYLDLVKKNQQQPHTDVFLKEEYNTEANANMLANFCTDLTLGEIITSVEYDEENFQVIATFDKTYTKLFDLDTTGYVKHTIERYLKKTGRELISYSPSTLLVQCERNLRDLLLMKEEFDSIPVSGIRDAELALPIEVDGRWGVQINGPIQGTDKKAVHTMWQDVEAFLGGYLDLEITRFTDSALVYNLFGLEAALMHLTEMIYGQMNGVDGNKGIGDLDYRYVRTMVDYMGIHGLLIGMSKSGHMVQYNRSVLGAMGGEDPWKSLIPGVVMGNYDPLNGMVEAITAGKTLNIGKKYRESQP